MPGYIIGGLAARIAAALCIFAVALPYALRRRSFRPPQARQKCAPSYLRRLWPHFWVGYAILALSTLHAGTAMDTMPRANRTGVVAATAAFFLLVFELALGLALKNVNLSSRRPLRRLHFWIMTAFITVLALHIWMNGH
ncbi:MAG TPA: hypothetical protein VMG31_13710 [Verrucomicrobiae bacterium]|nr:hypothetical protein [Verrucomicrobiae bacterium]